MELYEKSGIYLAVDSQQLGSRAVEQSTVSSRAVGQSAVGQSGSQQLDSPHSVYTTILLLWAKILTLLFFFDESDACNEVLLT